MQAHLLVVGTGAWCDSAPASPVSNSTLLREGDSGQSAVAFIICQQLGEPRPHVAIAQLYSSKDPILKLNRNTIESAIRSILGSFGRCSHVTQHPEKGLLMVFGEGYAVGFSWEQEDVLEWGNVYAPKLNKVDFQTAMGRLEAEHSGAIIQVLVTPMGENNQDRVSFANSSRTAAVQDSSRKFSHGKINETEPVASVFKLVLLNLIVQQIQENQLSWDTPMNGSNLSDRAAEMIVMSDNPATDDVLDLLKTKQAEPANDRLTGAERTSPVAALAPTHEVFGVKYTLPEVYLELFEQGSDAMRTGIKSLSSLQSRTYCHRGLCQFPRKSPTLDWKMSPLEVCEVTAALHHSQDAVALRILQENVAFVSDENREQFRYIGFKGGRDIGTLSAAYLVETLDGTPYCISVTWNQKTRDVARAKFAWLINRAFQELLLQHSKN